MANNVCCPYFRTMKCGDTKEHRHTICRVDNDLFENEYVKLFCISDNDWISCPIWKKKEVNKCH